ncbi:Cof-type HAD-IIB family hydrolase [Paenibacillus thermotolerans]|uniref:Cof-type HAD-IIB family hydrolase n=1 Tax=Paenibacillus thermotolerans TaxID=3027807 RepID=UPI002367A6F0|nr:MULTISPECIES: Cof-type HAD-IIB family hydrolase [unclassified Paenibacillus]
MPQKLIFFDIDGTLLDHEKKLPSSTKEAVARLQRDGHDVAIATGRSPFMFKPLLEELNIDSYVSLNGQYVVYRGEPIYRNPISPKLLRAFTEDALKGEHPIVYQDEQGMKTSMPDHERVITGFGNLRYPLPEHDAEYYLHRDIYQMLLFCTADEEPAYTAKYAGELRFVRWHPVSMDVMPVNGSKAAGIGRFIERVGIGLEDVYAFGDHYNDLEMLKFVGNSVAMGNAPDEVKRAAKYVTTDVKDDGIMNGLKQVGLLK